MSIKQIFSNYKKTLWRVNNEPLTKLSKLFLLVFVIFSFYIIFISLQQQQRIIDRSSDRFGYKCISLANKEIAKIDIYDFNDPYAKFGSNKDCQNLGKIYNKGASAFKQILKKISSLKSDIYSKERKIRELETQYSNMLLEKIAKQSKDKSILADSSDSVKKSINNYKKEIAEIQQKIKNLENIYNEEEYKNLVSFLKQKAQTIKDNFSSYNRFYALKVLLSIYLFLIPLFIVVFFIYHFAQKKEKYILSHLLANLLNVIALFILFYLLAFIYDIIPHVFFEKFFKLIEELNLVAFANYIAIAFFVLIFGLVIKIIQNRAIKKRELKNAQLINSYIKLGKCHKCGAYKNSDYNFCPTCGINLFETCKSCNSKKIANAKFCQVSGEE